MQVQDASVPPANSADASTRGEALFERMSAYDADLSLGIALAELRARAEPMLRDVALRFWRRELPAMTSAGPVTEQMVADVIDYSLQLFEIPYGPGWFAHVAGRCRKVARTGMDTGVLVSSMGRIQALFAQAMQNAFRDDPDFVTRGILALAKVGAIELEILCEEVAAERRRADASELSRFRDAVAALLQDAADAVRQTREEAMARSGLTQGAADRSADLMALAVGTRRRIGEADVLASDLRRSVESGDGAASVATGSLVDAGGLTSSARLALSRMRERAERLAEVARRLEGADAAASRPLAPRPGRRRSGLDMVQLVGEAARMVAEFRADADRAMEAYEALHRAVSTATDVARRIRATVGIQTETVVGVAAALARASESGDALVDRAAENASMAEQLSDSSSRMARLLRRLDRSIETLQSGALSF